MKPTINIISSFARIKAEGGGDHYAGTLDLAALKKIKSREIEVVMITIESIPQSLASLMAKSGAGKNGLLMFANVAAQESLGGKGSNT